MVSRALREWDTTRSANLDSLVGAHQAVTRGLPGRPSLTTELNHALIARLASELQGFARDLHDQAADALLTEATVPDEHIRRILRSRLEQGRKLDMGNANAGNLGNDFSRIGLLLWPGLHVAYPGDSERWHVWIEWLNLARNGISHNDPETLASSHAVHPLTLATFRSVRRAVCGFVSGMDAIVEIYLHNRTGRAPW
ncbi:hypothetical protein ACEXQD_17225 [Herbiconiux sp. P15]|uniref:hypothetical protein n=1 Tax=Herbiconiux liukaitaii TaxID=3342799 RepID=UPI0035B819B4